MITLVTVVHVVVCFFLILVILLQAGKGTGMGAAFGGAGAQTVFGGRGAQTFLGKITSVAAGVFMLTSVTLAYQASKSASVVRREAAPTAPSPASPLAPPPNAPESIPPAANMPGSSAPAPAQGPNQAAPQAPAK